MTRRGVAPGALVPVLLLCGVLPGCAPAPPALSEQVTVMVYQPRTDIALGRLAIQVRNGTEDALEIVGARLSSPDFVADTVWPNDAARVPAGLALDLRAPLPEVHCDADTDPVATIEFVVDGVTGVAERAVEDPYDLLPRLHREACLAEEIAEIATLTPREVILPDRVAPAILVIDVEPTGAPGTVTLDAVGGTTLLQPTNAGQANDLVELGITIDASGPFEVRIPFVPNRCDPHALMEDKVGTIIPLYVTTATASETRWMLPVTEAQRADFYAFFTAYCGLPSG
ncbi:hypothetical protein [Pseudolysinimonas yzui]|uniref:Uncharacterized protein n=1 Tax=Pseudolysinimonas yzui TaxID=2708254 RepID=A0A8J3GNB7_9MICO|nr:hypothetical protein [Pseudolysinimonas yzui]GHF06798.1 hypothetical protein GCM10011600_04300 [Pseudolysinimonas yzui]